MSVSWGRPSLWHKAATPAASAAASGRRRWSTVATRQRPGRAAWARSNNARLSGPPETARPITPSTGPSAARSAAKRSTASAAGVIGSAALRLGLGGGKLALEGRANGGAVDILELGIGFARLSRLAELHQRLAKVEQAVLGALALRVAAVIGEQGLGGGARLALVEHRAAGEIMRPAHPAMLGI